MGYSTPDPRYPSAVNYWPDNDDNTFYIAADEIEFKELQDRAKEYFGSRFDEDKISIGFEKIHTSCIHYDLYDPGDWTDFIIVTLK